MNAKLIKCGDTYLYMREMKVGELMEWHPEVQVTLRQFYPGTGPKWYRWDLDADNGWGRDGQDLSLKESIKVVNDFFLDTLTADSATIEWKYGWCHISINII